jgi:hypothetical protein
LVHVYRSLTSGLPGPTGAVVPEARVSDGLDAAA